MLINATRHQLAVVDGFIEDIWRIMPMDNPQSELIWLLWQYASDSGNLSAEAERDLEAQFCKALHYAEENQDD
jgi:hypothetical protein